MNHGDTGDTGKKREKNIPQIERMKQANADGPEDIVISIRVPLFHPYHQRYVFPFLFPVSPVSPWFILSQVHGGADQAHGFLCGFAGAVCAVFEQAI